MIEYGVLSSLSPLPTVNLNNVSLPLDGCFVNLPKVCEKNFVRDERCKKHYESLSTSLSSQSIKQCPYGFATIPILLKNNRVAFTGVVPFPRLGGELERSVAKSNPLSKIDINKLYQTVEAFIKLNENISSLENSIIKNQAMALHEIRKLNRRIKQTAERICTSQNPDEPSQSDTELVQIWKTSEIMSQQFDIIEILAGRTLTDLPVDKIIEVHKIILKCVKIYDPINTGKFKISCLPTYHPKILACNKTFPIILTVLIENAIKYSLESTPVHIKITRSSENCDISVSNISEYTHIDNSIFNRGIRGKTDKDGSGIGLYVAQLVAKQHNSFITVETLHLHNNKMLCTFKVGFKVI